MKYVPWIDYKALVSDLKRIYQMATEDEALLALDRLNQKWDSRYLQISLCWRAHWDNFEYIIFACQADIRKAIYTINAIELLNSMIPNAIKKRKLFRTGDSAQKMVYLAIQHVSKKWTMPIRNWKSALNEFMIKFEYRLTDYL